MAYPFGGHPTFSSYCTWAASLGCSVITRPIEPIADSDEAETSEDGAEEDAPTTMCLTLITAPSGRYVIIADIAQDERLVPTMVAYLDRRLGLDSPFAKI